MQNVEQTIASQYANSPILLQLIQNMNEHIDPSADLQAFYDYVWNIDTAVGFGLNIWGRIVGVGRELTVELDEDYFGFNDGHQYDFKPFGEAPFYTGVHSTGTVKLSDDAYRTLILVKALANISRTTSPALNQLLQNLFAGRGRCYVNDMGNMTMRYTFEFFLEPYEVSIIKYSGALPRPAAVQVTVINTDTVFFGFQGSGGYPFGEGTFIIKNYSYAV